MLICVLANLTVCKPHKFVLLSLMITLVDADDDPSSGGVPRGENQQGAMGGGREDWKSTVPAAAKLLLYSVRDSADVFPPLKSVAGGLCSLLENYEVWFTSQTLLEPRCLGSPQRTQGNKQAIESLASRVKSLAESLCAPVSEGDAREELRRKRLKQ